MLDLEPAHEGDGFLKVVALLAGHPQLVALNRDLDLELAVFQLFDDLLSELAVDALLDDDLLADQIAPEARSGSLMSSALDGSSLRRTRCVNKSSCICFNFGSSSAIRSQFGLLALDLELFEFLKSNRVAISRAILASALSTSARSVFETMSKLGIRKNLVTSGSWFSERAMRRISIRRSAVPAQHGLGLAQRNAQEDFGVERRSAVRACPERRRRASPTDACYRPGVPTAVTESPARDTVDGFKSLIAAAA